MKITQYKHTIRSNKIKQGKQYNLQVWLFIYYKLYLSYGLVRMNVWHEAGLARYVLRIWNTVFKMYQVEL
jgi:hypothetical protein